MGTDDDRTDTGASNDDGIDKQAIRERVWDALEESGEARFPFPPHDRIPNFAGADEAADRLADQPEWCEAGTIKANPDAPQLPVRRRALRDGKAVYVAVPRLREERCFLELNPDEISPEEYDDATTVSGISSYGTPRGPGECPPIDLIVSGSVAVDDDGARIGKGEGYSDLEFALLREFDRVVGTTPVATTVHERQVVADDVATGDHDVSMDLVVTPDGVSRPEGATKPPGIDWDRLSRERIDEIPALASLEE